MKLTELLTHLDTKVPIRILELSPPEHPEEIQHVEVIFDSEDSCYYFDFSFNLDKIIYSNYMVTKITFLDDPYSPYLKINVISMEKGVEKK